MVRGANEPTVGTEAQFLDDALSNVGLAHIVQETIEIFVDFGRVRVIDHSKVCSLSKECVTIHRSSGISNNHHRRIGIIVAGGAGFRLPQQLIKWWARRWLKRYKLMRSLIILDIMNGCPFILLIFAQIPANCAPSIRVNIKGGNRTIVLAWMKISELKIVLSSITNIQTYISRREIRDNFHTISRASE